MLVLHAGAASNPGARPAGQTVRASKRSTGRGTLASSIVPMESNRTSGVVAGSNDLLAPAGRVPPGVVRGYKASPVRSRHVGDPILKSNLTRRTNFALLMVEALENNELIHEAPAIVASRQRSRRPPADDRSGPAKIRPGGSSPPGGSRFMFQSMRVRNPVTRGEVASLRGLFPCAILIHRRPRVL